MNIAYIRVSTDKQETINQRSELLEYASKNKIVFDKIIELEMSSRKDVTKRRISELYDLPKDSVIYVTELSRIGRSMLEVCGIIDKLDKSGINIIFIRQKELSVVQGEINPVRNLLMALYGFVAETERKWISERTKASLSAKKALGIKLGRKKGTGFDKLSDEVKKNVRKFLECKVPIKSIAILMKVPKSTARFWIKRYKQELEENKTFLEINRDEVEKLENRETRKEKIISENGQ